jgi:hypothetical protein
VGPIVAVGVEPLLGGRYGAGTPVEAHDFTPGYRVAFGLNVGTGSPWSGDLRVSGLWRSFEVAVACPGVGFACAPPNSSYRALAVEGQVRFTPSRTGRFRPYLGAGAAVYSTRLTEGKPPTGVGTEHQVRPVVLGTLGLQLSRGPRGVFFVEATLAQFVGSSSVARLLPVQVGWRW